MAHCCHRHPGPHGTAWNLRRGLSLRRLLRHGLLLQRFALFLLRSLEIVFFGYLVAIFLNTRCLVFLDRILGPCVLSERLKNSSCLLRRFTRIWLVLFWMSPCHLTLHSLRFRSMGIMVFGGKLARIFDGWESLPLRVQRWLVTFKLEYGKLKLQSQVLFLKLRSILLDFQNIQVELP